MRRHLLKKVKKDTVIPGINEDNIIQVSENIESRVTKKLSQDFSWTGSWNSGRSVQARRLPFESTSQARSGTVSRTSRISYTEN